MFLDVKDLAVRKLVIHGRATRRAASTTRLVGNEADRPAGSDRDGGAARRADIGMAGDLETKVELGPAPGAWSRSWTKCPSGSFDLFVQPASQRVTKAGRGAAERGRFAEIGFFEGEGLCSWRTYLREQVLLALPMKVICRSDCRGLCPNCGANLNHEECRCETHSQQTRDWLRLARLKQDWLKKQ
jgi:hypothetical protein